MGFLKNKCTDLECFACDGMCCKILDEVDRSKECKFRKTHQELKIDRRKAMERLHEIGREDLIAKYTAHVSDYVF